MSRIAFLNILGLSAIVGWCNSCGSTTSSPAANANGQGAPAPTVEVVKVTARKLAITMRLPGELQPYEAVAVYPKETAFVDSHTVDRGSVVKSGQLMARLVAPGLAVQHPAARSILHGLEAQIGAAVGKSAGH